MIINLKKYREHSYLKGTFSVVKKMFLSLNQPMLIDFFGSSKVENHYSGYPLYKIDPLSQSDFCTTCRVCEISCPVQVIKLTNSDDGFSGPVVSAPKEFKIDLKNCIKCGYCVSDCPEDALEFTGKYETAEIEENFFDIKKSALDHKKRSFSPKS